MTDHYYTHTPHSQHDVREFTAVLRGREYRFQTDAGVFSRTGIDRGTELLIEALLCGPGDTVLDLGCGYGPIGIAAAQLVGPTGHVYLTDVNQRAVELARTNLRLNGVTNATVLGGKAETEWPPEPVDWIISNPPIRAGKAVVYGLMDEAYNRLLPGGGLMVVIRTKQGAASLEKHLAGLFGGM
jgi:16S rRNA (guanine1207-N2)-methyltransferase